MDFPIQHVLSDVLGDGANVTSPARPMPTNILGALSLMFSFSALRDWVKLIVIGGFFESCRRLGYTIYHKVINHFYITVEFQDHDDSYDWMMVWLSKQKIWAEARELQVSTKSFGLSDSAVLVPGEEEDTSALVSGGRRLAYMPMHNTTQTLWYKGSWMRVTRSQTPSGYQMRAEDKLTLCIMTRHHHLLNSLLLEAKKAYMAAKEDSICVYMSDISNDWRHVACRPKRPLRSIILDPGIKDLLLEDARDFLASKAWYSVRGIPFRRGYLLHGAPGSGKTSIIHSLAGELGLDVYIISLSRAGMDDSALSELISDLPVECIALMEDIDAAFTQSLNRDAPTPTTGSTGSESDSPDSHNVPRSTSSRVSLSGLLNALDGIGAQEGRILFATTNKYSSLDPALCRPGRMDIHIEFRLASKYQAGELFRCFYLAEDDEAMHHGEEESEKERLDSESTSDSYDTDLIDLGAYSSRTSANTAATFAPGATTSKTKVAIFGDLHCGRAASKVSRGRLLKLADQFEGAIPEREFSIASLQGYLMGYKIRPIDAVRYIGAWIEKERSPKTAGTNDPLIS